MDILTYINTLGFKLYPVQTFVLKMAYGIPLSEYNVISFYNPVTDRTHSFTEPEYLRYLYSEGRSSVVEQPSAPHVLFLAQGRRAGKTVLLELCASYSLHTLIDMADPHAYFGMTSVIGVSLISQSKDMAQCIMQNTDALIQKDEILRECATTHTMMKKTFTKSRDNMLKRIELRTASVVSRGGLKGSPNYFVGFDEAAWSNQVPELYNCLMPSTLSFCPRGANGYVTGPSPAKIFCVSTPVAKEGWFWDNYNSPYSGSLSLRIPSWEMNPSIPVTYYKQQMKDDLLRFLVEFGAEFSNYRAPKAA